jgi:hypothetical protein
MSSKRIIRQYRDLVAVVLIIPINETEPIVDSIGLFTFGRWTTVYTEQSEGRHRQASVLNHVLSMVAGA